MARKVLAWIQIRVRYGYMLVVQWCIACGVIASRCDAPNATLIVHPLVLQTVATFGNGALSMASPTEHYYFIEGRLSSC